jgi:hypothetical protein
MYPTLRRNVSNNRARRNTGLRVLWAASSRLDVIPTPVVHPAPPRAIAGGPEGPRETRYSWWNSRRAERAPQSNEFDRIDRPLSVLRSIRIPL